MLKWWIFALYALSRTKVVDTVFSENKLAEIKKVSFSLNLGLSFQNINSIYYKDSLAEEKTISVSLTSHIWFGSNHGKLFLCDCIVVAVCLAEEERVRDETRRPQRGDGPSAFNRGSAGELRRQWESPSAGGLKTDIIAGLGPRWAFVERRAGL